MERGGHGEDRLAVLDRHHAPGREAAAVANAVDLVDDGHRGIAGAQEIGVQRMRQAAVHRAMGRDQRLADHLAAEHALPADLRAQARGTDFPRASRCRGWRAAFPARGS